MSKALKKALAIEKACEELGPYPGKGWISRLKEVSQKYGIRLGFLQKIKGWGNLPICE